jgi:hypothetical protein
VTIWPVMNDAAFEAAKTIARPIAARFVPPK